MEFFSKKLVRSKEIENKIKFACSFNNACGGHCRDKNRRRQICEILSDPPEGVGQLKRLRRGNDRGAEGNQGVLS